LSELLNDEYQTAKIKPRIAFVEKRRDYGSLDASEIQALRNSSANHRMIRNEIADAKLNNPFAHCYPLGEWGCNLLGAAVR
jgi:hypothetical protein